MKHRDPLALHARTRHAGPLHDRRDPRGGDRATTLAFLREEEEEVTDPTLAYLRRAIAHAPVRPIAPIASGLRGWWVGAGWWICASCASRLLTRGCALPEPALPVWADEPEPYGVCATCEEVSS